MKEINDILIRFSSEELEPELPDNSEREKDTQNIFDFDSNPRFSENKTLEPSQAPQKKTKSNEQQIADFKDMLADVKRKQDQLDEENDQENNVSFEQSLPIESNVSETVEADQIVENEGDSEFSPQTQDEN